MRRGLLIETDRLWNAIVGNGGQESQCGWCKDRWGLSWQITPRVLIEALAAGGGEAKRAEAINRTALDGTWGEIVCVGYAVDDGIVGVIHCETEADTLRAFVSALDMSCHDVPAWQMNAMYIGHNVAGFDLLGHDGGQRALFIVEHAGRPGDHRVLQAGDLGHAAFRR